MNRPLLLGFAGPAGCGKSSAAALLAAEGGWRRVGFADPIRECVAAGFGIDAFDLQICKRSDTSVRNWLRVVGDHWRMADPDVFVRLARARWSGALFDDGVPVAVDDVRFSAEAFAVRDSGGSIIHVMRPGVRWSKEHATEHAVEFASGDFRLRNDGDIAALHRSLMALVLEIGRRRAA